MAATIFILTSIFLFQGMAGFLLESLQNKFDISVYFKEGLIEPEILQTKELILALPGVKSIDYVSKEQALADFTEKHKYDDLINQALEELGDNPFPASLNIRTDSVADYDAVEEFLKDSRFEELIEKVDYYQRKPVIEKFYGAVGDLWLLGILAVVLISIIAFSISFVATRLAVHNSGEEINIMQLVGASKWFIRGPFLAQGVICGLMAGLANLVLFLPLTYFLSAKIFSLTGGFEMFRYFTGSLLAFLGLQLLVGAGLGAISSLAAVGKYLEK